MKVLLFGLLLLVSSGLHARDLPGAAAPTIDERLRNARDSIRAKDWTNALAELRDAAREEPRNADVFNLLGYSYRKQAKPDLAKAFAHYQMALRIDPGHRGAHEYIGEAYLLDGKLLQAESHLVALEKLCGNKTCEEYADLERAIADYRARNK